MFISEEKIIEIVGNALENKHNKHLNVLTYPKLKEIVFWGGVKQEDVDKIYNILDAILEYLDVDYKIEKHILIKKEKKK